MVNRIWFIVSDGSRWLNPIASDGSMIIFHASSEILGKDMFINGSRVPLQIPGTP